MFDLMETLDCIALRRSCRKYKPDEVEWEKIGKIILAARDSPSSGNLQNWSFIIVQDDSARQSIAEASYGQLWMGQAPVHIVVCGHTKKASQFYGLRGERLYTIQNCAAAVQNILLAATDIGLGSCWVGAFDEEQLRSICGIPDDVRPQAIVTLGYAAEKPREPPWKQEIYTITFLNSFGGRMNNLDNVLGYHSEKVRRAVDFGKKTVEKGSSRFRDLLDKSKEKLNSVKKKKKKIPPME